MTITSVLFDLDGTLLDRDKSIAQFIDSQYDRLHHHSNHIHKVEYTKRFIELDANGYVWKDEVYRVLVAEFKIEGPTWQDLLHDYETQFQFHCVPFPLLTKMLATLKQQGYSLGIISNGRGEFQHRAISGLGIGDYFDAILISEIEGMRKPESAIFQRGIDRLGSSAQNSIFVGDNPTADIDGAKQAGMRAIWKRNPHWQEAKRADAIIDELIEIPSILERFDNTIDRENS